MSSTFKLQPFQIKSYQSVIKVLEDTRRNLRQSLRMHAHTLSRAREMRKREKNINTALREHHFKVQTSLLPLALALTLHPKP
ncbi:hypothetical protein M413DRAFT_157011 [Hebeloma cylindrosporum]|uniref:Uncharacterized protein n=1 Tax=Hebeloma cylindrosporum TaxID=76867 RepID=A0A0C3C9Q8_HEBCY|nr:hypothetical protein M413DRAFT_157011 [Hebeloma cylindrosporum h7]